VLAAVRVGAATPIRGARRLIAVRTAAGVIPALAVAGALAGCGAQQHAAVAVPPALPRAPSAGETRLLDRAEQTLLGDCMQRHGFRFWVVARPAPPATARFPYVVDDTPWARAHGYGSDIERRGARAGRADPNRRYFHGLTPARQRAAVRALNGVRPEGLTARLPSGIVARRSDRSCMSQAQRALYGDLQAWFAASTVTDNLFGARAGRVTSDPSFAAATRRWSACMRASGHRFAAPLAARAAVSGRDGERGVAVAEAACAVSTGLSATVRRLDRRYQRAVDREFRTAIATTRRLQREALPRARAVTDRGRT